MIFEPVEPFLKLSFFPNPTKNVSVGLSAWDVAVYSIFINYY